MNMDELEQAISALPLEEPPAGLRASILLATAYRPAPVFSMLELAAIGAMGAVGLWLIVLLVSGGGTLFVHTLTTIGSFLYRALTNPSIAAWLAAGASVPLWLSLFTGFQPIAAAQQRSERRAGR